MGFIPEQKVKIVSVVTLFLDLYLCVLIPIVVVNEQENYAAIYKSMNVPGGLSLLVRWFFTVPPIAYYVLFAMLGVSLVVKESLFKDGWRMLHVNCYALLVLLLFWCIHSWAMLTPMRIGERFVS